MMPPPFEFHLRKDTERQVFVVHLSAGAEQAVDDFAFDRTYPRFVRVLRDLDQNTAKLEDLRDLGVHLWSGLMAGQVGRLFNRLIQAAGPAPCHQVRLRLPVELEDLPWEAIYREGASGAAFVAAHPHYSITRTPLASTGDDAAEGGGGPDDAPPPIAPRPAGPVRILAVLPLGSNLDVEREWSLLDRTLGALAGQVELKRLDGRVTPSRLAGELRRARWDIVHYAGHGDRREDGNPLILLNDEGGGPAWTYADVFANLFAASGVRLAVLNSCYGAQLDDERRSLSSLGAALLRFVPAVVAMRWEIGDDAAIDFADRLYQYLFQGLGGGGEGAAGTGRIDLALGRARREMFESTTEQSPARLFVTPVLYLVPGHEQLFDPATLPRVEAAAEISPSSPQPAAAGAFRAEDLAEVAGLLRRALCVPVVGPRFLTGARPRGEAASGAASGAGSALPGPLELARLLGMPAAYPRDRADRDGELCQRAGDWMHLMALQWVCEHHLAREGKLYALADIIGAAYSNKPPPRALRRIAGWPAPAVFYLYFDALLEAAYGKGRARVVDGVDQPVPRGDGGPLLIHVLGSYKNARSLVLSETDHDALWERFRKLSRPIAALLTEPVSDDEPTLRRSLFFLGVSPRDPVARRLARRLLEQRSARPIYFACHPGEENDPYWRDYPVVWLAGDPEALVQELSARVGGS
jgi:hypothetical protein